MSERRVGAEVNAVVSRRPGDRLARWEGGASEKVGQERMGGRGVDMLWQETE